MREPVNGILSNRAQLTPAALDWAAGFFALVLHVLEAAKL